MASSSDDDEPPLAAPKLARSLSTVDASNIEATVNAHICRHVNSINENACTKTVREPDAWLCSGMCSRVSVLQYRMSMHVTLTVNHIARLEILLADKMPSVLCGCD